MSIKVGDKVKRTLIDKFWTSKCEQFNENPLGHFEVIKIHTHGIELKGLSDYSFKESNFKRVVGKNDAYKTAQQAYVELFDLKAGDEVAVNYVAESYKNGWENSWSTYMGNKGDKFKVAKIHNSGIRLSDGYDYPFFSLTKIKSAFVSEKVRLSRDYTAEIQEDGSVKVGCQTVSFETLEKIYNIAKKIKE